jgi:hypothetical protein
MCLFQIREFLAVLQKAEWYSNEVVFEKIHVYEWGPEKKTFWKYATFLKIAIWQLCHTQ